MWNRFQAVMVVFFAIVIAIETWRILTGPFAVKPHAFIDGMIAIYLLTQIIQKNGKAVIPTVTVAASTVIVSFTIWAIFLSHTQ